MKLVHRAGLPHGRRDFAFWLDLLLPFFLHKEIFGSPRFLDCPFRIMPCSKTPVVCHILAISAMTLLPSLKQERVGFHTYCPRAYPYGPQHQLFRGSITRPESLFPETSDLHYWFSPLGSLLACWLRFNRWDFRLPFRFRSPTGQYHRISSLYFGNPNDPDFPGVTCSCSCSCS